MGFYAQVGAGGHHGVPEIGDAARAVARFGDGVFHRVQEGVARHVGDPRPRGAQAAVAGFAAPMSPTISMPRSPRSGGTAAVRRSSAASGRGSPPGPAGTFTARAPPRARPGARRRGGAGRRAGRVRRPVRSARPRSRRPRRPESRPRRTARIGRDAASRASGAGEGHGTVPFGPAARAVSPRVSAGAVRPPPRPVRRVRRGGCPARPGRGAHPPAERWGVVPSVPAASRAARPADPFWTARGRGARGWGGPAPVSRPGRPVPDSPPARDRRDHAALDARREKVELRRPGAGPTGE